MKNGSCKRSPCSCQICSTMYGNADEDMFQKFLETDQLSCSFAVKREFLWRGQWAEKLVYLQSVKSACAFLPSCGFSGNCPRFFKVFTGRETILTFLLLLKCLCVRAKTTFSRKFPDTCGGKQNLLWLFTLQRTQIWTANIWGGVKLKFTATSHFQHSTLSHIWQKAVSSSLFTWLPNSRFLLSLFLYFRCIGCH